MLARMTITLAEDERNALQHMAEAECRYPREQLRYLLRREAQARGLLDPSAAHKESEQREQPQRAMGGTS